MTPHTPSSISRRFGLACALAGLVITSAQGATLQAEYLFNNSLAAQEAGVASLTAINPLGSNSFVTDNVFGQNHSVYVTSGNSSAQAGLNLDTTGLVSSNNFSVEMVLSVTGGNASWKRLFQAGSNDNGLYLDVNNRLNTYANGSNSGAAFGLNTYHHLIFTVAANSQTQVWLDGNLSQTLNTSVLNITAPGDVVGFFLDDAAEYTNARTALIRLWDAPLAAGDVATLYSNPLATLAQPNAIPEPGLLPLIALALTGLWAWRYRAENPRSGPRQNWKAAFHLRKLFGKR